MKSNRRISIRYKILLLLTLLPLVTLSLYLLLAIKIFEKDKIAYVFDSSGSVSRSVAAQAKSELISMFTILKPAMQEYIDHGAFGSISNTVMKNTDHLLDMGVFKKNKDSWLLQSKVEKTAGSLDELQAKILNLKDWLERAESSGRLVRAPFEDGQLLLIERVGEPNDPRHFLMLSTFIVTEFASVFTTSQTNRIFLTTNEGEILFGLNRKEAQNISQLIPADLIKEANESKLVEGTKSVIVNRNQEWLVSYSKTGVGELLIISLVDKKLALGAVEILIRKSLLFFGLLISITIVLGLFASGNLTASLSDLFNATKRVAEGNFKIKVDVKSKDEVGSLAESFNLMAEEVARLVSETAEKTRMEGELKTAKTVQETLFPNAKANLFGSNIVGHYEPASECGGDWWHYCTVGNKIFFWIGDATGHGAPAALITSAAKSAATIIEKLQIGPAQAMSLLNHSIYEVSKGRIMMTFFLASYDPETKIFTYANASHEPPFLIKKKEGPPKKKDLIPLNEVNDARLGQSPTTEFEEACVQLDEDDTIFFYTDGIPDLRNQQNEAIGERNFVKIITDSIQDYPSAQDFMDRMNLKLIDHRKQAALIDDITFFVLKVGPCQLNENPLKSPLEVVV
jgi:sigma-B regulation protein RsbU (phosphoserine phosphatase)